MGIDRNDRVIGPEKLDYPPHTRVAGNEVPIEEEQGRPIATGTELEERRRRGACLHGDSWGKLADRFCPVQNRFRYALADEPLEFDEHFHRQKGVTTAGEKIIVDRHGLGLEQPPPQGQQFSFQIQWPFVHSRHGHRALITQQPVEQLAQPSPLNLSRRPLWQLVEDQNAPRNL